MSSLTEEPLTHCGSKGPPQLLPTRGSMPALSWLLVIVIVHS